MYDRQLGEVDLLYREEETGINQGKLCVYKRRHGEQEGQGGAVQCVSCDAGSEQGQTAEAL